MLDFALVGLGQTFLPPVSVSLLLSYYNLDLSFCLSICQLLRQFLMDRDETWQEGRGRSRIEPKGPRASYYL